MEIAVMGSAALAWLDLGHPVVALTFAVVAAVSGVVNLRAEIARDK